MHVKKQSKFILIRKTLALLLAISLTMFMIPKALGNNALSEETKTPEKEQKEISKCLHSGIIPEIYKDRIDEIEIVDKKVKVEKKLTNSKYGTEEEMINRALEGFFVRDPERNVVYCPGNEKLRCTSIKSRGEIKLPRK